MTLSNGQNEVTVEMDYIQELNELGSVIANTGSNSEKHSRNTFANTDFTINDIANRTDVYGVPASSIDFRTPLVGE